MSSTSFVKVQAPATTANLGPGFDSLGIALGLHNTVELSKSDAPVVEITGEGADSLPKDETNLTYRSACRLAREAGYEGHWNLRQHNTIPLSRGMGSSSAAIVAGLVAAKETLEFGIERQDVLAIAVEIEGHPDNVAPALMGGLTVCFEQYDGTKAALALDAPAKLQAVLAVPNFHVNTEDARKALPKTVPYADAVFNTGQAAAVLGMLASGQYDQLADAMRDRLHQPYRAHLIPGMEELIRAALDANARGSALSGSGPTIVALAEEDDCQAVLKAMLDAGKQTEHEWTGMILPLSNKGACVIS